MENRRVSNARHTVSRGFEQLTVEKKGGAAAYASYDAEARTVTLRVSPAENAPEPALHEGSLFSSCEAYQEDGCAVYRLTLREDAAVGGFYVEPTKNGVTLTVREKRAAAESAYPLSAHTIVLDAGHGGTSTGTLGLLGSAYPEKDANLDLSDALAESCGDWAPRSSRRGRTIATSRSKRASRFRAPRVPISSSRSTATTSPRAPT